MPYSKEKEEEEERPFPGGNPAKTKTNNQVKGYNFITT